MPTYLGLDEVEHHCEVQKDAVMLKHVLHAYLAAHVLGAEFVIVACDLECFSNSTDGLGKQVWVSASVIY